MSCMDKEDNAVVLVCAYCEREIQTDEKEVREHWNAMQLYYEFECPHCGKVMGVLADNN